MAAVKFPLVTSFCGGLVIFAACAYLGHRAAEIATYRWQKPMSFESLKKQNDRQLRDDLLTLQGVKYSQVREDTPSDLQKAADYLGTIRSGKPPALRPLLDLQIATDYIEMARLEREAGNTIPADRHQQMAEGILRSLGWQDVSGGTTAKLTKWQLWWKRTK
jgi:predicted component of type VI protein secretion system